MGAWGGEIAPAAHYAAVTPSDTIGFAECEALYIGVAGNVVAVTPGGTAVTFVGVAAGLILPIRAKRINATSTTATSIVALYTRSTA